MDRVFIMKYCIVDFLNSTKIVPFYSFYNLIDVRVVYLLYSTLHLIASVTARQLYVLNSVVHTKLDIYVFYFAL
jgi:hypothetical protein